MDGGTSPIRAQIQAEYGAVSCLYNQNIITTVHNSPAAFLYHSNQ